VTSSWRQSVQHLFAGIGVADYEAMRDWYETFMGRPPDLVPNDIEVCWQLSDSGWIYVKADPGRAGNAFLTFLVDDLDGWLAALERRGIPSGPVDTHSDGVRVALVTDPEGNTIQLGETPG
jgi:catechol 2,3-dioxygenase-like lactoylglutathione lyase family enzyme